MNTSPKHRSRNILIGSLFVVVVISVFCARGLPATMAQVQPSSNPTPQNIETPAPVAPYVPVTSPQEVKVPSEPIPSQVVIQFTSDTSTEDKLAYIDSIGGSVIQDIEQLDTVIVSVPEESTDQPLPESLAVVQSEPDFFVVAQGDAPNDPRYPEQWALPAIGAPNAWAQLPADAPKITVAVIDSGICANHPDLAGRIEPGWDFLDNDAVPQDDFGHGCSVAGIIAANINDGIGIAGVAPNAQIMPLRVLNSSGVGSYSNVAAAIVYAADNDASIINLSLGGVNPSTTLENAVNYAVAKGVIVVAAAGNNGMEGVLFPAAYPDVIAVGSVDPDLQHSSFSNFGSKIDVWAPGRDILTTRADGSYSLVSGTSFAVPYVTGSEIINLINNQAPLVNRGVLNLNPIASPGVSSVPTQETSLTPSPELIYSLRPSNQEMQQLLLLDLSKNNVDTSNLKLVVDHSDFLDDWAAISYYFLSEDGVPNNESLGIAHYEQNNWKAITNVNPSFNNWLRDLPSLLLNDDAKQFFFVHPFDVSALTTYSGHKLPWQGGLSYRVTTAVGQHTNSVEYWAYDFALPNGTEIWASNSGTVAYVTQSYGPGACDTGLANQGNRVVVNNDDGSASLYLHLQQNGARVSVGQRVNQGDLIGISGNSGYSCGYHLHFQVQTQGGSWWTQSQQVIFNPNGEPTKDSYPISGNYRGSACPAPNLNGPSDGYVSSDPTVNFNWGAISNCGSGYTFRIKTSTTMEGDADYVYDSSNNRIDTGVGDTFITRTIRSDSYNKDLYWGVKAANAASANWSIRKFRIEPGGGSCSPNADQIALYVDANYGGSCIVKGIGEYPNPSSIGISNDSVSSIKVGSNVKAYLCRDDNYGGTCDTLTSDDPNLGDNGIGDNQLSSGKVQTKTSGNPVVLYQDPNYSGASCGLSGESWQNFCTGQNDSYSSISVQSGWSTRVWQNTDRTGASRCFSGSIANLSGMSFTENGNYNLDNEISSFAAYNSSNCPSLAPSTPSNLRQIGSTSDSVTIAWDDVSGETGYKIYKWNGVTGTFVYLATVGSNQTSFTETRASCGWNDYYEVSAFNTLGESSLTSWIQASTQSCPTKPPAPSSPNPTDNAIVERGTDLTLGWSTSNTTQCYTRFWGGPSVDINTGWKNCTNWYISSQWPGAYQWQVNAQNDAGTTTGVTWHLNIKPNPPTSLIATPISATQIDLSWQASSDAPNHIDGYDIYKNGVLFASVGSSSTSYSATGLICATNYPFEVKSKTQGVHSNISSASANTFICPPNNDLISNATIISNFPSKVTQEIFGSTLSSTDPFPSCIRSSESISNTTWYRFTPSSTQTVNVTTASSRNYGTFDSLVVVFKGSPSSLSEVACNDDILQGNIRHSSAIFFANAGTSYYIMVANWADENLGIKSSTIVDLSLVTPVNAPTLLNPVNGFNTNDKTPNLSWSGIDAGSSSQVQITSDPSFYYLNIAGQNNIDVPAGTFSIDSPEKSEKTYYWRVRALDGLKIPGLWSEIRSFVVDITPPSTPVLSSPSDNLSSLVTPKYTWKASTGATIYQFEYDDNSDFSSPIYNSGNLTTLTHQPPTQALGTYYWHVRAGDAAGNWSPWSGYRTITIIPQIPTAPALTAPSNTLITNDTTPTFTWGSVSIGNTYQLQVDGSSIFDSPDLDVTNAPGILTYTPTTPLPDGSFYWRVRAISNISIAGPWSSPVRSFTIDTTPPSIPTLISPSDNSTVREVITLSWSSGNGAIRYQYQIDNAPDFNSPDFTAQLSTTSVSLKPTPGSYFWRVRAADTLNNWSGWSVHRSVTVWPPIPGAPVLVSPLKGAITNPTPNLTWSVNNQYRYEIQVDNNSVFTSPEQSGSDLSGTSGYSVNPVPEGTYYWRVRAINQIGEPGAWSLPFNFFADATPPKVPVLASPAVNGFSPSHTPKLSVLSVSGGARYQFQVSSTYGFESYLVDSTSGTTYYTLTAAQALPYGKYFWRARSFDKVGNASPWSEIRNLSITTQTSPRENTYIVSSTPSFNWLPVSNALEYQFQVSKSESFDFLEIERYQVGGTSFISSPLDFGSHFWRMRIRTSNGWSEWMPVWKFTLTAPLSTAPILISPNNSALITSSTPSLSWNMVHEDDSYEIQMDNVSTFAHPEQVHTGQTGEIIFTANALPDGSYYWRVRTSNYLSAPGPWSAYRKFTIDTKSPTSPLLGLPLDGASIFGNTAFSWKAPTTATRYQFQYGTDLEFTNPLYTSGELSTISTTPPIMNIGSYYWRVRARDTAGNWSPWCPARVVNILPIVPPAPTLVSPVNGFITNDDIATLSWKNVISGNTYQVQIDNSNTFTSPESSFNSGIGELNFTPEGLTDGIYYWHVRAVNINGQAGPWSSYRSFKVDTTPPAAPALTAPTNAATVIGTPSFTWLASTSAVRYQFEYDNDADFSSPAYTSGELTVLKFAPPAIPDGTYSWHVRAKDSAGNWSSWSTPRAVTILPAIPPAPVLGTPANAAVVGDPTPDLTWNSVPSGNTYQLEISNSTAFTVKLQTFAGAPGVLTYAATLLSDGTYYWHVRAVNINSQAGPWSSYRSFKVDTTPPAAPALTAPTNAATVIGTPSFTWLASTSAIRYQFEYDNDADFSSPGYTSGELTVLKFAPPAIPDGTYSWHVRAKDSAGNWSSWSTPRVVTILPLYPPAPELTLPLNGTISQNPAPQLSWKNQTYALSYRIQIDNNSTFSSPEVDSSTISNSFLPPKLADGVYYWRVNSTNSLSNTGNWSAVWRVTVNQLIPYVPSLITPVDGATDSTGIPVFGWNSAQNSANYEIAIDDNTDFSSPEINSSSSTLNYSPIAPLLNGEYFWRVRGVNIFDTPGPWSTVQTLIVNVSPDAPELLTPQDNDSNDSGLPTFTWEEVGQGIAYQVQIDDDIDFNSPVFDDLNDSLERVLTTPLPNGVYYWRVRGFNRFNLPGTWSNVRIVTIDIPPGIPVLTQPSDNSEVSENPVFTWENVPQADEYQFQLDNDADFSSADYDNTTQYPEITIETQIPAGSYFWRVRAMNEFGTTGEWSNVWRFDLVIP